MTIKILLQLLDTDSTIKFSLANENSPTFTRQWLDNENSPTFTRQWLHNENSSTVIRQWKIYYSDRFDIRNSHLQWLDKDNFQILAYNDSTVKILKIRESVDGKASRTLIRTINNKLINNWALSTMLARKDDIHFWSTSPEQWICL